MVLILYGFVVFLATLLGSFVGLGGGVIIKPVLDVINAHSLTEISFFSSCAVFAMSITSTTRHIIKKTPIKPSIVLLVALGSVGGGLVMNAGAYDGSMDLVVEEAQLLMPDGKVMTVPKKDLRLGYRKSVLKEIPAVALQVKFVLKPGDPDAILAKMQDFAERRRSKQPLEYPSAGSTFKRPEGMFAGKLIMDAGLAGFSIGGAQVSEKHCGFVINRDHATARDVRAVIAAVQQKVWETAGVRLEEEVIYLGDF